MDFGTLFGPVATGVLAAVSDVLPVAIPVLVGLAGITIAINVFRKFGVKR